MSDKAEQLVSQLLGEDDGIEGMERSHGHGVSLRDFTDSDRMGFQGVTDPAEGSAQIGELSVDGYESLAILGGDLDEPEAPLAVHIIVIQPEVDPEGAERDDPFPDDMNDAEFRKEFPSYFDAKKFVASELGASETMDHLLELGFTQI